MASAGLVFARRPGFSYGDTPPLDFGQVFELTGEKNDGRLLDLGLVARVGKGVAIPACGYCGARFKTDHDLSMHGRKRHSGGDALNPQQEDAAAEKELSNAEKRAPLHMDRTKASRDDAAGVPEINTKGRAGAKKKRGRQSRRRTVHGS